MGMAGRYRLTGLLIFSYIFIIGRERGKRSGKQERGQNYYNLLKQLEPLQLP